MRTSPAATAAPEPDEEPPGICSGFQGLRAGGNGRSKLGPPSANSWVASLPSSTPPCALNLVSTTEAAAGPLSSPSLELRGGRGPAGCAQFVGAGGHPRTSP